MKICKIPMCLNKYYAKDLCESHYDKISTRPSRTWGNIEYFCLRMWDGMNKRVKNWGIE